MNILVFNCGSSSLKFQIAATDSERINADTDLRLAHGAIERIGGARIITLEAAGQPLERSAAPIRDVRDAIELVLRRARRARKLASQMLTASQTVTLSGIEWFTAAIFFALGLD